MAFISTHSKNSRFAGMRDDEAPPLADSSADEPSRFSAMRGDPNTSILSPSRTTSQETGMGSLSAWNPSTKERLRMFISDIARRSPFVEPGKRLGRVGIHHLTEAISGAGLYIPDILTKKLTGEETLAQYADKLTGFKPTPREMRAGEAGKFVTSLHTTGVAVGPFISKIPKVRQALQIILGSGVTFGTRAATEQIAQKITTGKPIDIEGIHFESGIGIAFGTGEVGIGKFLRFVKGLRTLPKARARPARLEADRAWKHYQKTGNRTRWDAVREKYIGLAPEVVAKTSQPPKVKDFGEYPLAWPVGKPSQLETALQTTLGVSQKAANNAIEIARTQGVPAADQYLSAVKGMGEEAADAVITAPAPPPTGRTPAEAPITPEKGKITAPTAEEIYTPESLAARRTWQETQMRAGGVVDMSKAPPLIPITPKEGEIVAPGEAKQRQQNIYTMTAKERNTFKLGIRAAFKLKDGSIIESGYIHALPEGVSTKDIAVEGFTRPDTKEFLSRKELDDLIAISEGVELQKEVEAVSNALLEDLPDKDIAEQLLAEGFEGKPKVLKPTPEAKPAAEAWQLTPTNREAAEKGYTKADQAVIGFIEARGGQVNISGVPLEDWYSYRSPEGLLIQSDTEIVGKGGYAELRVKADEWIASKEVKPEQQILFGPAKEQPPVEPPIDITEGPPGGKPTAEFGESFIKRVTRRAEAGLAGEKEYGTPASLVGIEKETAEKLKAAVTLSRKETAAIAKEKKAYQKQRVAQAYKFLASEEAQVGKTAEERLAETVKFFKGEQFPKQRWQPIDIDAGERNAMHEYIEGHEGLQLHKKRDTSAALTKLFDGQYLANYEVAYITDVFPELGKIAKTRRRPGSKGLDIFISVLGSVKSFRASFDISLLGRQMYPLLLAKPSLIAPGLRESLKLFGRKQSAAYATALSAEMRADPAWQRAKDMGVQVIEPGELAEEFPSRVVGTVPGIARSERAFIEVGNLLRVSAHDMIETAYAAKGKPLSDDASKAVAGAINDLSGRAAVPDSLKQLSLAASTIMWSPRLALARGKAPFRMFSRTPAARNLAIRSFSTLAALTTTLMLLAKYGHERNEDIDGELNPLSTDFGKIRYKNQHIDVTGGYGAMMRTVARTATGLTETASDEIVEKSRIETIKQFGRAKTAPAVGFARKVITQKDWLGRPAFRPPGGSVGDAMTEYGIPDAAQIVAREVYEEILPLPMVDVMDAFAIDGVTSGIIAAPLAFGGIGVLTYEPMEATKLRIEQNKVAQREHGKQWDELGPNQQKFLLKDPGLVEQQLKADVEDLYQRQEYEVDKVRYKMYRNMPPPIRKELDSIGVAISAPARKSGDWRMNDERYDYYVKKSTELMQAGFEKEFKKPFRRKQSVTMKQRRARELMNNAKLRARNEVKRLANAGDL